MENNDSPKSGWLEKEIWVTGSNKEKTWICTNKSIST